VQILSLLFKFIKIQNYNIIAKLIAYLFTYLIKWWLYIWATCKYGWSWKISPDCNGYVAGSVCLWSI